MNELERFRLTDAEVKDAFHSSPNSVLSTGKITRNEFYAARRAIADAATEKALREVVAWLRAFSLRDSDHPTHIVHEGRGYGEWLKDATDELEAMLGAAKEQGRG